jgi:hypothetical protein
MPPLFSVTFSLLDYFDYAISFPPRFDIAISRLHYAAGQIIYDSAFEPDFRPITMLAFIAAAIFASVFFFFISLFAAEPLPLSMLHFAFSLIFSLRCR